jgi:hypothetical protein
MINPTAVNLIWEISSYFKVKTDKYADILKFMILLNNKVFSDACKVMYRHLKTSPAFNLIHLYP